MEFIKKGTGLKLKRCAGVILCTIFCTIVSYAQETVSAEVIQCSGVIIDKETLEPVIGVHIFSPKYGKGGTTDYFGRFSFAIKEADSLIVSAIGYEKQIFVVPYSEEGEDKITTLIELVQAPTYLKEVEVNLYPSEDSFKDAILALNTTSSRREANLKKTTDYIAAMQLYKDIPRSSNEQFQDALAIKEQERRDKYEPRVFAPLNPVAWVKLIRSLKKQ